MSLSEQAERIDKILFTNARVVDPDKPKESKGDVVVEDGKLKKIGKIDAAGFDGKVIDAGGRILCPGLIDMHVHLREPGREDEETVESGTDAAMMGGFVGVCPMPNTEPPADNAEVVKFLKSASQNYLVDVLPIAAVTRKRAGEELTEMAELVKAGAVAFSDDGDPVATAEIMRRAMEYAKMFDVPIIEHCEEKTLTGKWAMHEGSVSTRLGMPGYPRIAEDIIVARDIQIAEFTGGKLHIAHISTKGAVALVRQAKEKGLNVTCEVTPHHFTLNHEAVLEYDTNAKMSPPLRTSEDVDAIHAGLKDGTIDAIATDHAPHAIEEKEVEFDAAPFGILGLETALGLVITQLVEPGILTLSAAIAKMSQSPAQILNLEMGRLKAGAPATLTLFDPDVEWTVDKKQFLSNSSNTPFHGWKLKGEVCALYNKGILWQRDSQKSEKGH